MKYQIEENCLTIFLPKELDHHQTEEIRREADLNERMKKILKMSGAAKIIRIYEEERR